MLIENKKTKHREVISDEQWKMLQEKIVPGYEGSVGRERRFMSSLFTVIREDQVAKNLPEELKKTIPAKKADK